MALQRQRFHLQRQSGEFHLSEFCRLRGGRCRVAAARYEVCELWNRSFNRSIHGTQNVTLLSYSYKAYSRPFGEISQIIPPC
jgi:hypothetical protein